MFFYFLMIFVYEYIFVFIYTNVAFFLKEGIIKKKIHMYQMGTKWRTFAAMKDPEDSDPKKTVS